MKLTLQRLKQRKIFHWGAAYLAGAWVLLQLTDLLADQFGWPSAFTRSMTVVLAVGFVAALIVAWYHGERGEQRVTAVELIILTSLLVTAGATVALVVRKPEPQPASPAHARVEAAPSPVAREPGSIAVLPFVNMSGDKENEYFSDGITEEILNVLAQVAGLRVAARTSSFMFKGANIGVNRIGDSLNVATVLEGSVRKMGNQVRITAQLINTRDGYHMWSEAYDRELKDVFRVQEEIARAIVDALKVKLSDDAAPQVRGATSNPRAHDLYLLGLHHWNRRTAADLQRAIDLFTEAARADPRYARAYAGLAATYAVLPFYTKVPASEAVPKARAAVQQTLAIDSTLAEPYATLGDLTLHFERDPHKAETFLRRAIELNPQYATGHAWYAEIMQVMDRREEAERHCAEAFELDPLSPRITSDYASSLEYRDPARAELLYRRAIELQSTFAPAHWNFGALLLRQGRWQEAIIELRHVRDPALMERVINGMRDPTRRPDALRALTQLARGAALPSEFAAYALKLGNREMALQLLEQADRANDPILIFQRNAPELEPLRGDQRFERLFKPVRRF